MDRALIVAIVIAAGAVAGVNAQQAEGQRGNRGRGGDQMSAAEVVRILDGYALVQAQDALQLNDAQYGPFVTRLKKLQETRRRNQQGRNQILMDLRRLVGPQGRAANQAAQGGGGAAATQGPPAADEAAVREKVRALRAHDEQAALELRRAYDALDEGLDPRQQARFRIFEEQLERRKLDLIMRARDGAAGRVR